MFLAIKQPSLAVSSAKLRHELFWQLSQRWRTPGWRAAAQIPICGWPAGHYDMYIRQSMALLTKLHRMILLSPPCCVLSNQQMGPHSRVQNTYPLCPTVCFTFLSYCVFSNQQMGPPGCMENPGKFLSSLPCCVLSNWRKGPHSRTYNTM